MARTPSTFERDLNNTPGAERDVKRTGAGRVKEPDDIGRSSIVDLAKQR